MTIFNFDPESDLQDWLVVDDVVMGGRSDGRFYLSEEGRGVFTGEVSLENNGGFSSVRHRFTPKKAEGFTKAVIRLRGDGKRYQFRVKSDSYDRQAYVSYFQTSGEWQVVEIPLSEMYPTFRGRTLSMPNYPGRRLSEIAFLIANKQAERFRLELDFIELR